MIRLLTGEPRSQALAASDLFSSDANLFLTDVVAAECVYVLSSVYGLEPRRVAELMRSVLGFESIDAPGEPFLLRALSLYSDGHDFADAYIVAIAELADCPVASFDKGIDRAGNVTRIP